MTWMILSFPILTMSLDCTEGSEIAQAENCLDRKLIVPGVDLVAKRQFLPFSKIESRP
jgi:hypothetical protein